jgi:hypothetical protein
MLTSIWRLYALYQTSCHEINDVREKRREEKRRDETRRETLPLLYFSLLLTPENESIKKKSKAKETNLDKKETLKKKTAQNSRQLTEESENSSEYFLEGKVVPVPFFNCGPRHEGVFGEWRYRSTLS